MLKGVINPVLATVLIHATDTLLFSHGYAR